MDEEHPKPHRRIGDILTRAGLVTSEQVEEALPLAEREGLRLGEALVRLGALDHDRLTWALGLQFDLSYVDLQTDMIDWDLLLRLPLGRLEKLKIVPLARVGELVTAVIADPTVPNLAEVLHELLPGRRIVVQLAAEEAIAATLAEARRRKGEPRSRRMSSEERAAAFGSVSALLAQLETTRAERLLAFAWPERDARLFIDGARVGESSDLTPMMGRLSSLELSASFTPLVDVPAGFYGLRKSAQGEASVRCLQLTSVANGGLLALERLPEKPPPGRSAIVRLIHGYAPFTLKAALADALRRDAEGDAGLAGELPAIFLEAHVDARLPRVFQVEVPHPHLRTAVARAAAPIARPARVLVEVETLEDLARLTVASYPDMADVLALLRAPAEALPAGALPAGVVPLGTDPSSENLARRLREIVAREDA